MPVSSRRRTRRRDIQLHDTSDAEGPDSSPSRPSTKKRKVCLSVVSSSCDASTLYEWLADLIDC